MQFKCFFYSIEVRTFTILCNSCSILHPSLNGPFCPPAPCRVLWAHKLSFALGTAASSTTWLTQYTFTFGADKSSFRGQLKANHALQLLWGFSWRWWRLSLRGGLQEFFDLLQLCLHVLDPRISAELLACLQVPYAYLFCPTFPGNFNLCVKQNKPRNII